MWFIQYWHLLELDFIFMKGNLQSMELWLLVQMCFLPINFFFFFSKPMISFVVFHFVVWLVLFVCLFLIQNHFSVPFVSFVSQCYGVKNLGITQNSNLSMLLNISNTWKVALCKNLKQEWLHYVSCKLCSIANVVSCECQLPKDLLFLNIANINFKHDAVLSKINVAFGTFYNFWLEFEQSCDC